MTNTHNPRNQTLTNVLVMTSTLLLVAVATTAAATDYAAEQGTDANAGSSGSGNDYCNGSINHQVTVIGDNKWECGDDHVTQVEMDCRSTSGSGAAGVGVNGADGSAGADAGANTSCSA